MFRNPDSDWRMRAACRNRPADDFFPKGRPGEKNLSPCHDCPVREQCLEFALASPWRPEGIWAGLTTTELAPLWAERHPRQRHADALALLGLS